MLTMALLLLLVRLCLCASLLATFACIETGDESDARVGVGAGVIGSVDVGACGAGMFLALALLLVLALLPVPVFKLALASMQCLRLRVPCVCIDDIGASVGGRVGANAAAFVGTGSGFGVGACACADAGAGDGADTYACIGACVWARILANLTRWRKRAIALLSIAALACACLRWCKCALALGRPAFGSGGGVTIWESADLRIVLEIAGFPGM